MLTKVKKKILRMLRNLSRISWIAVRNNFCLIDASWKEEDRPTAVILAIEQLTFDLNLKIYIVV